MRFVCLFKIRIDDDPAAMLADYELLVGSDVNKTLRSDRVEAAATGVSVIDRDNRKMVVDTGADAVVGAHGPWIDLPGAFLTHGTESLLLLRRRLNDRGELFLLGLKVIGPYGDVVLQGFDVLLLLKDGRLGVVDVLLGNLTEKPLILNFLVDRIVLTAVGDVIQLLLVLFDLGVTINDVLPVLGDCLVVSLDDSGILGLTGLQIRYLILKSLDLRRKLTTHLNDLVNRRVSLLKRVECLKLFLDADLRVSEVLLKGNECLPLVYRGLDFLDFLVAI